MTIVEKTCPVTACVDTHADVHVADVVDGVGGVLGIESFTTTEAGCVQLIGWQRAHGSVNLVGVEGTGSYGAGLTRQLERAGSRWSKSIARTGRCDAAKASPTPSTRWSPPGRRCRVRRSGCPRRALVMSRRSGY